MYQILPEKKVKFFKYNDSEHLDLDLTRFEIWNKYPDARAAKLSDINVWLVGCGYCTECRLKKSRDKANRMMLQAKTSGECWGVTLTYDNDNLPYGEEILSGDGEYLMYPTLRPEDVAKFNKRLRQILERDYKKYGMSEPHYGVKFYCCGEYGSEGGRPHYHFIFFNLPLPASDVKILKHEASKTGEQLYASKICEDAWSYCLRDGRKFLRDDNGNKIKVLRGRVRLNEVTWDYCAYVGRYIMKKQYGDGAEIYKILGVVPPFSRCSTKVGIGKEYFLEHIEELLASDKVLIKQGEQSVWAHLPDYYLRLAENMGYDISHIKEARREEASRNVNRILDAISQDYFDYQANLEEEMKNKAKALPRAEF